MPRPLLIIRENFHFLGQASKNWVIFILNLNFVNFGPIAKFKIQKLKEKNKINKARLEKIWKKDRSDLNYKLIRKSLPKCPPSDRVKRLMEKNQDIMKENLVSSWKIRVI